MDIFKKIVEAIFEKYDCNLGVQKIRIDKNGEVYYNVSNWNEDDLDFVKVLDFDNEFLEEYDEENDRYYIADYKVDMIALEIEEEILEYLDSIEEEVVDILAEDIETIRKMFNKGVKNV